MSHRDCCQGNTGSDTGKNGNPQGMMERTRTNPRPLGDETGKSWQGVDKGGEAKEEGCRVVTPRLQAAAAWWTGGPPPSLSNGRSLDWL